MLRNYLTSAWRNFMRNKAFSAINLLGLTLGMTACLLIVQYVYHERSYDQFHDNKQDVYRLAIAITKENSPLNGLLVVLP